MKKNRLKLTDILDNPKWAVHIISTNSYSSYIHKALVREKIENIEVSSFVIMAHCGKFFSD